jgi:hypothetical protein
VDEVAAVALAEDVYDCLLRDPRGCVGVVGEFCWSVAGRPLKLRWVLRPNSIWRGGRVFLICSNCSRPATRLYLVRPETTSPACRNCWSLAYPSQLRNYKDNAGPLRGFMSCRDLAVRETEIKRLAARRAARERAARRRST